LPYDVFREENVLFVWKLLLLWMKHKYLTANIFAALSNKQDENPVQSAEEFQN
jgi:hypothetical protein